MSTVEEIERVIEKLPPEDFDKLSELIARRSAGDRGKKPAAFRDHRAFLNSYAPEDEGLYDEIPIKTAWLQHVRLQF